MQKHTEIVAHVNKALAVTDFEADLTKFATYKISIHHFSDAGQKGQIVTKLSGSNGSPRRVLIKCTLVPNVLKM